MENRVDRFLHIDGLIEHYARGHLLGNVVQMLDQLPNSVHDGNRVGVAALLHDRNIGRSLPVDAHDVGLNPVSIFRFSYVVHRYPGMSVDLQWNVPQLFHAVDQTVGIDEIVVRSHLHVARGKNQVRIVDRLDYVHRTELAR